MNITTTMMGLSGTAMMIREGSLAAVLSRAVIGAKNGVPVIGAKDGNPAKLDLGDPKEPNRAEWLREHFLRHLGLGVERKKDAAGNVVTIARVSGPIMSDPMWAMWMGGCWSEALAAGFRQLAKEAMTLEDASPVVVVWDCPGGTVAGLTEINEAFAMMLGARPVHSFAKECMCSLAYNIACASDTIAATPTADVGSIGTRITLTSFVRALDQEGIDVKNLASGKIKLYGDPTEPITEEVVVYYDNMIEDHSSDFFARVAGFRGLSVDEVAGLEGAFFDGARAMERGLVDEVVDSPESWILSKAGPVRPGALTAGGRPGRRAQSASAKEPNMAVKTFEDVKKEFASELSKEFAAIEKSARDAGFEAGKAEGVKLGKAEAEKPATTAELAAKFPGEQNASFCMDCLIKNRSMAGAVDAYNGVLEARLKDAQAADAEKAKRLASLGGAGDALAASAEAIKAKGGGGAAGNDSALEPGVQAFKGEVERGIAAGKTVAQATEAAAKVHGQHYPAWLAAGQPGVKKADEKK